MLAGWDQLSVARFDRLLRALRDVRETPQERRLLNRTAVVDALDGEIIAYVRENITIADVLPDDAPARTYGGEKFERELNALPNIKHGRVMSQEMINLLRRIVANQAGSDDLGFFTQYRDRQLERLVVGIEQTMELMLIGMALDEFEYDRNGQQFTATFGVPSDLKVVVDDAWNDSANATPIADIQQLNQDAVEKYGTAYDRITLSRAAFRDMVATDEFREKSRLYSQLTNVTADNFPTEDTATMRRLAERMLDGMSIEFYDTRYWRQGNDGDETSSRFLPEDRVILSNSAWDNDASVWDFGNAEVTESLVGQMVAETNGSSLIGQFDGARRGSVAYATAPPDLNPPQITFWGVSRGFPRLFRKNAHAQLDISGP